MREELAPLFHHVELRQQRTGYPAGVMKPSMRIQISSRNWMSDPGDHAGGVQEWPITHDVQTGHPPKPWRHGPTLRSFDSIVGNASVPTAGTSGNNHEWTTAGQPQTLDGLPEAVLSEQPAAQKRVHEDPALAITTEQPAALLVSIAQHHRVRV